MSVRRDRASDAPLLAWGEALRAAKLRRAKLAGRIGIVSVGIGAMLASIVIPPRPRLVWNASASAPIGLYSVSLGAPVGRGDMVIAWAPARVRRLASERHYLPLNVPLVKRVGATAGDETCALGTQVFVNGRPSAQRLSRDGTGRMMPAWSGCVRLRDDQLFLLTDNPASFDGRYFGITEGPDVVGKARLLWRW